MKNSSVFALRLKAARLAKGLTQEEVGILAGLDEFSAKTRINQYENGVHVPHFETAENIAKALDVPTAYFYSKEDEEAEMLRYFYSLSTEKRKFLLSAVLRLDFLK